MRGVELLLIGALSESHAGISWGRGVSIALAGMIPISFWRANVASRTLSQPGRNLPLNLAIQYFGALVRSVRGSRCVYWSQGLLGATEFQHADPCDALVGHVLFEEVILHVVGGARSALVFS